MQPNRTLMRSCQMDHYRFTSKSGSLFEPEKSASSSRWLIAPRRQPRNPPRRGSNRRSGNARKAIGPQTTCIVAPRFIAPNRPYFHAAHRDNLHKPITASAARCMIIHPQIVNGPDRKRVQYAPPRSSCLFQEEAYQPHPRRRNPELRSCRPLLPAARVDLHRR